jgi:hypothetical protein
MISHQKMIISTFSTEINSLRSDRGPATIGDLNGDGKKIFSLAVPKKKAAIYLQSPKGFQKNLC